MTERLAIVGTGVMGLNHARTAAGLPDQFELSHIIDIDVDRANQIRATHGANSTIAAQTIDELDGSNVDAAIIASPSHLHAEQANTLMERGVHVLVEKPVSLNIEDAKMLSETAKQSGKVLMVGHVELFNPAVQALKSVIGDVPIKTMRFKRLSNVTDRSRMYHDVVNDLMLHDISIAQSLAGSADEPEVLLAHGRRDTPAHPDPAEAIVRFGDIEAHFRASRAFSGGKVRTIEIETADKLFHADLMTRSITRITSNEGHQVPDGVFIDDMQATRYMPQQVTQPLTLEQIHFADSITGKTTPEAAGVSINDALRIMRITQAILSQIET